VVPAYAVNIKNLTAWKGTHCAKAQRSFFMEKKNKFMLGVLALALVFGMVLAGCGDPGGSPTGGSGYTAEVSTSTSSGIYRKSLYGEVDIRIEVRHASGASLTEEQKAEIETALKKLTKADITVTPLQSSDGRTLTIGDPYDGFDGVTYEDGWFFGYFTNINYDASVYPGSFQLHITRDAAPSDAGDFSNGTRFTSAVTVNYPATEGFTFTAGSNSKIVW
jgi:hypothetical protein